ncbi:hypothetical protein GEMRC1_005227 [Eukaryota sp. GEM-RC1]
MNPDILHVSPFPNNPHQLLFNSFDACFSSWQNYAAEQGFAIRIEAGTEERGRCYFTCYASGSYVQEGNNKRPRKTRYPWAEGMPIS